MSQRDHDRSSQPRPIRSHAAGSRRGAGPVLALQRAAGNRGTTRLLARKGGTDGTFEHSVRIGKLGPIEITESNVADWIAKKSDVEDLIATTVKGDHSDALRQMSDGKTRIDSIEVQSLSGQNSWVVVTFKNARIRAYASEPTGKTEAWKATDFDAVDIKRTSIGKPRP